MFGIEPAGGRAVRALDLVGVDLELRPRIDLGGRRQQQAAAGLLRIGLRRRPASTTTLLLKITRLVPLAMARAVCRLRGVARARA